MRLDVFGIFPLVNQKACVGVELELVLMPAPFSGPCEIRGRRADPSEGEELRSENPLLIGLLRRTLALIVSRPDLLEDGRQVIGQIWNQVIQVKQVCEDAVGFEEPDPFCRCRFSCLFQLQMQFMVRGPFIYKMSLVSIDTFVKRTVTKSACVLW